MEGAGAFNRRTFVSAGALAAAALAFGPELWRHALASPATPGPGPYGPLGSADPNGLMLPPGFTSRQIARGGEPVAGSRGQPYPWHVFSDGQAMFSAPDGGWILVSNSESLSATGGGSSAIRFGRDATIRRAYRILGGTNVNCAGGPTPWGTWLSCEEWDGGQVWECDPTAATAAQVRPAMGVFNHEAACVDPKGRRVYMTEDEPDGGFYRFTPTAYPHLASGLLEVAAVSRGGRVTWTAVPDPSAVTRPTRAQVPGMTRFANGEGIWFDSGFVYFTTKGDNRVHVYDTRAGTHDLLYDRAATPDAALSGVDNVTVSPYGDVYVCEDGGDLEICLITPEREVSPFLRLTGDAHSGSELAGVIFDPSGTRMYFSSQRGFGLGVVYEVRGPFRTGGRAAFAPLAGPVPRAPRERGTGSSAGSARLSAASRRRIARSTLLRRGIAVRVRVTEPGTVELALRTGELGRTPGRRGSEQRPSQVTLARATRRFSRPGVHRVTLRVSPRVRRRLRRIRHSPLATLTVQMRGEDREAAIATRRVRILRAR